MGAPTDSEGLGGGDAIGEGRVQLVATELFSVAGLPAYHTSVIVGGLEYYFDGTGIESAPALWSHLAGRGKRGPESRMEVLDYGRSALTGSALRYGLQHYFEEGSYDILYKNCNAFTDAALYFLTRTRLQRRFCRVERLLLATVPLSTGVLNRLLHLMSTEDLEAYRPNPLAVRFSVEHVVAACDALDARDGAGRAVVSSSVPCVFACACSCMPICQDDPTHGVVDQVGPVVVVAKPFSAVAPAQPPLAAADAASAIGASAGAIAPRGPQHSRVKGTSQWRKRMLKLPRVLVVSQECARDPPNSPSGRGCRGADAGPAPGSPSPERPPREQTQEGEALRRRLYRL